ncbi:uncharacterized protein METZ01_LOCUS165738, partial [marine metagenome]
MGFEYLRLSYILSALDMSTNKNTSVNTDTSL